MIRIMNGWNMERPQPKAVVLISVKITEDGF